MVNIKQESAADHQAVFDLIGQASKAAEFTGGIPPENCMAIELSDGALADVRGKVEYASEFYE